jgi:monofunctional biosynthetic peptidoglycan transglycosylase
LLILAAAIVFAGPAAAILVFGFLPPPITPLMLIRLVEGYPLHHQWVAYTAIAPALAESVIASEDNLFCEESLGFDIKVCDGPGRLDRFREE